MFLNDFLPLFTIIIKNQLKIGVIKFAKKIWFHITDHKTIQKSCRNPHHTFII